MAVVALPAAALAQATPREQYEHCMSTARQTPEEGLRMARAWAKEGGGSPAGHCSATALFALRRFPEAAVGFEAIAAAEVERNPKLASELYAHTGVAWIQARDFDRAYKAQTRGLELDPDNLELRIDRGLTLAEQQRFWEAIDDFNLAREQAPARADILIYLGTAYRKLFTDAQSELDIYMLARDLIDQALAIDPTNPDGLLQRGILKRLGNDIAGARADWQRVVELAPNTPPADAAKGNLQLLETRQ